MEFRDSLMFFGGCRRRYERINNGNEKAIRLARPRLWMKKAHGRVKGVKLSRPRRMNWKPFWAMFVLWRKVAKIYGGFVERMKMDEARPAITFSCQWGLPVLSHSSVHTRRKSSYNHMSLTWL